MKELIEEYGVVIFELIIGALSLFAVLKILKGVLSL